MTFEEVKIHLEKHKNVYVFFGTAIITALIMRSNVLQRGAGIGILPRGVTNTASQFFTNRSTINVITVLERTGRGHPGYPVRNLETMHPFFSQGEAAKAFGISESALSGHLKGKIPDVSGLHFERVSLPT